MKGSDDNEFPGFQILAPEEDHVKIRRTLSRLQRRAPRPLQLKPANASSVQCNGAAKSTGYSTNSSAYSSSSSTTSFTSCYHSKDPIPLLSPLVLPSLREPGFVQGENVAKAHSFSWLLLWVLQCYLVYIK